MTDYNSYPTLLQSSQTEYVSTETIDSNNPNNNIIYNSAPVIVLNSQKPDMALLQNSMMNDGQTYLTIQAQPTTGATDLTGAKLMNAPIIIQNSQSQYQQQPPSAINSTQMTSLTPSQLQSLSYLMQTQMAPQFIQTSNGLIQIIPQSFITTQPQQQQQQQQQQQNQAQNHDHSLQAQMTGLPTISWSLGNFNGVNNAITLDNNQLQSLQVSNLSLPQLIPVQHVLQSNNSFFTNQNDDHDQLVSSIVDLNANDKMSLSANKKPSRRKRKQTTKLTIDSSQLSSPSAHPTSTNEVTKEAAESSSNIGKISYINGDSVTQYDNKGRPFSFLCTDCPKKFTLNSRLSAHMRCHTGMRPFTCTVCGFSFTQKSYLIRHAAVHKEERPFHCEKCQKSYKHYGSLANHRKLHRKDEKLDADCVKVEPSVICRSGFVEFGIGQSYENSGAMIGQVTNDDHERDGNHQNSFTISSTTANIEDTSYLKQLSVSYPISISTDNVNSKSANIFFQEQPQENDDDEEDVEDCCYDHEEEEEVEGGGNGQCIESGMLDLSTGMCLAPSEYHL